MSLSLLTASWNVHGLPPKDENLDVWLHLLSDHDELADIYVIGVQEVPSDPSSLVLDYYIRNDPWTKRVLLFLSTKGIVMVDSVRMMGLLLIVAVKPRHLPHIRNIRTTYIKTAFFGLLGTKGSVSLRFDLYGESFCFVNNHFVAGENYAVQRNSSYESVMARTLYSNCDKPSILDNRFILLFGDFNYRIDDLDKNSITSLIEKKDYQALLEKDQLILSKREAKSFEGFEESAIQFQPTYKYDLNSNIFDTSSKQRSPAYTDRILYREVTGDQISPTLSAVSYNAHMAYTCSDHKPISAEFTLTIPASLTATPPVEFRFDETFIPWTSEEDGVCVFYVKGYQTSSWDWVGLYPLGFKSPKDYYTYEWSVSGADQTGEDGCMILFDDIPEEHGYYLFGYWSRKFECMMGISQPFHVEPVPEPDDPDEITVENPSDNV